jgi:hypothetical protein
MNRIRATGRRIALLAGLATALLAVGVVPAFAMQAPPAGGVLVPAQPAPVYAGGGMPGWQIALIALVAAVVAAIVAVRVDRARAARQQMVTAQRLAVPGK